MKYLAVIFTLVLAGCGSGSDGGDSVSLADLVGVWDNSKATDQAADEVYFIIEENGNKYIFDYDGDSESNGSNCYYKSDGVHLTDQGNGNFLVVNSDSKSFSMQVTLSGDTLTFSTVIDDVAVTDTSVKTSRLESDFTPLCNELR